MTTNLRALIHMSGLRLCTMAQWEIRRLFQLVRHEIFAVSPFLGSFLAPKCVPLGYCDEFKNRDEHCPIRPHKDNVLGAWAEKAAAAKAERPGAAAGLARAAPDAARRLERPRDQPSRAGSSATNRRMTRARRGPASRRPPAPPRGSAARPCSRRRRSSRARRRRPRGRPSARRCTRGRSTCPTACAAEPGAASGPRPGSRSSGRSARRRRPRASSTPSASAAAWRRVPQARAPGIGQVGEARRRASSAFGPDQRVLAGQVDVVAHDHQRAGPERRVEPAGRVGQHDDARARARWNSRTGWTTRPGWLPSYRWNRPWSMTTGSPPSVPSSSRPAWPGRGRRRPAGQVRERDRDGVLEVVGQPAEPRPEDDPDLGHERRCARGPPPRARRRGRLLGGRDRSGRVEALADVGGSGRSDMRASRIASRGADGRGPEASSARRKYRHRDADHVPSGADPRAGRGETATRGGQRSARSDRRRTEDP